MSAIRAILVAAPVIFGLLLGAPEEVAAKCRETPTLQGTAMVLNGAKIGEVEMTVDLSHPMGPIFRANANAYLEGKTVLYSKMDCWVETNPDTGVRTVQESVDFVTMDYLGLTLARMGGVQNAYRAVHGRFSGDLGEFGSLPYLLGVQATLLTTETGWSASIHHVFNSQVTCHLAVGDRELLLPGQTLGQVHCIDNTPRRADA